MFLLKADPTREISASRGAKVKTSKVVRVRSPRVGLVLLSDTAAREKAITTRLILEYFVWNHFRLRCHFYDRDRLDSPWMAQLLAGGMHHRFHRFDRLHMEGLRTILAGAKFAQPIELIEFCEIMTSELQPSCGVMRKTTFARPCSMRHDTST